MSSLLTNKPRDKRKGRRKKEVNFEVRGREIHKEMEHKERMKVKHRLPLEICERQQNKEGDAKKEIQGRRCKEEMQERESWRETDRKEIANCQVF